MWNNADHVLSLWAELSYWAELRYCAELSYWAELSCWLLWVVVVQLGWRSPALLYWRRGGFRTWCGGAICCFGELSYTGSWQLTCEAFFAKKNISLRYLSCIEYFFDQIFFVGKFGTNAGSATWWSKLEPIERWIFLSIEFACFVAGLSYFFKWGLLFLSLFCVNYFFCALFWAN